jgi:hypothetical protein
MNKKFHTFYKLLNLSTKPLSLADLNGSVGSVSDLKPKGHGFESRTKQGYICWWSGSKRGVMNVSPCGFKVKEFALKFPKNLITN